MLAHSMSKNKYDFAILHLKNRHAMDRELVATGDETHKMSFKASLGKSCDFSGAPLKPR